MNIAHELGFVIRMIQSDLEEHGCTVTLNLTRRYQEGPQQSVALCRSQNPGGREDGSTHPFPDVLDLRSHHAALRVLVSHPVLSAAVDHATAGALQHIAERGEGQRAC